MSLASPQPSRDMLPSESVVLTGFLNSDSDGECVSWHAPRISARVQVGVYRCFCEGIASPYLSHNARALADSPGGYDGPDDKYILKGSAHWQGGD